MDVVDDSHLCSSSSSVSCDSCVVSLSDGLQSETSRSINVGEDSWSFDEQQRFISFAHLRTHLNNLFGSFGLRVKVRDTHFKGESHTEDTVVRRKYQCAHALCPWFAWYGVEKNTGLICLNPTHHLQHSHDLFLTESPSAYVSFDSDECAFLNECKTAKLTPIKAHAMMEAHFLKNFVESKVRSYLRRERRKEIWNDVSCLLEDLKKLSDAGDVQYTVHLDEENVLDAVFLCPPGARDDFLKHGKIIGVDATYRTNRYSLPLVTFVCRDSYASIHSIAYAFIENEQAVSFCWAFKQFQEHLHPYAPSVFITDGCPSIASAIATVFPSSHHHLCWWHLQCNFNKHVRNISESATKDLLKVAQMGCREVATATFERFLDTYRISAHDYTPYLWKTFEKWCDAFLPEEFVGRVRSTQANESQHARLKVELSSISTLCDCLRVIISVKKKETYWKTSAPPMQLDPLFVDASRLTPFARLILGEQFKLSLSMTCSRVSEGAVELWMVKDVYYCHIFQVSMQEIEDTKVVSCGCVFPRRVGLPCPHCLAVLFASGKKEWIPHICTSYWRSKNKESNMSPVPICSDERQIVQDVETPITKTSFVNVLGQVKQLFEFEGCEGFDGCVDDVVEALSEKIRFLKTSRKKAKGHDHSPADTSTRGHPFTKRLKSASEKRRRVRLIFRE
jgi:hypothetical protein